MEVLSAVRAERRAPLLQIAKSAVAMIAAWLICGWLIPDGPPPVFAAIAALLVVQPSLNQSYLKAIERSAGVVGVIVASGIGMLVTDPVWSLPLSIVLALGVAWVVRMTAGTTNQVAISALLVIAMGAATPGYALDRIIETVIGAALGFVVSLVLVPPVATVPARRAVESLGDELAATLERLADALQRPQTPAQLTELMVTARLLRPMREAADAAIEDARACSWICGGRHRSRFDSVVALRDRFSPIVTQVVGMTRAFYDRYDAAVADDAIVQDIAEQLRRHSPFGRHGLTHAAPEAPVTETLPP